MTWSLDARIPIRLLSPGDLAAAISASSAPFALLVPAEMDVGPEPAATVERFEAGGFQHMAACACCAGRPPTGVALDRLFQARIRGHCPWFGSVVALVPDAATRLEVESALQDDPLTSARFRLG